MGGGSLSLLDHRDGAKTFDDRVKRRECVAFERASQIGHWICRRRLGRHVDLLDSLCGVRDDASASWFNLGTKKHNLRIILL
jgi:hypothetical protein